MGAANENQLRGRTLPKSLRHKQVLDVAAEQPEASFETIAEVVPSATVDLVENVLEEYGDPAENPDKSKDDIDPEPEPDDTVLHSDKDASTETTVEMDPEIGGESPPTESESQSTPEYDVGDIMAVDHSENVGSGLEDWESGSIGDLTDRQRELLETIAEYPDATQREIGDILDVSAATVCTHMSAIEGCDWEHRDELVTEVIESSLAESATDPNGHDSKRHASPEPKRTTMETRETDPSADVEQLTDRIITLEEQLQTKPVAVTNCLGINDPELLHKVIHVCMKSETFSEDEELQLIKALV